MRAMATFIRIIRDRRGTSIIEMALALPILMVLLVGLIDVARCYSTQMSIQQAAARALERLQVGNSRTDFEFVRTEAAAAAGTGAQVTIDKWLECDQVRQPATTLDCPTGQLRARYVQVTINSSYTPYFRFSPLGARRADGTVALTANSAVRYQ